MTYHIEMTDTFGGDANYSWVKRASFDAPDTASRTALVRKAKALLGLSGIRTKTDDWGDMIRLDVQGACIVAFITWEA